MRELEEIEDDPAWARIVDAVRRDGPPATPPDLVDRTLARVRSVTVFWELLRLATLEAFWSRFRSRKTDAISRERRDSRGSYHPADSPATGPLGARERAARDG